MPDFGHKRKLYRLRKALEIGDFSKVQEEMLREGEIGKLADAIIRRENERQAALEKETKQKEFLRDLISDISHQLKTPIASLTVFTDLLIGEAERESRTEQTQDIAGLCREKREQVEWRMSLLRTEEQQLERMKWLTEALLQLARLEAESVSFVRKKVQLKTICELVRTSFLPMADERNITMDIVGDDAELLTDPDWFMEALGNVVKNAIEYSPEGGRVELGIRKTPLVIRLHVTDEGEGIPEDDRLKIFERFYRVNGSAVNPSSVGIGLALSKKITTGCGGRLYVESRHRSECNRQEKSYTKMIFDFPSDGCIGEEE